MALMPQKCAKKDSPVRLIDRSKVIVQRPAAYSSSKRYAQFSCVQQRRLLKICGLPANSSPASRLIDSYHIDPIYEFMT